MTLVSSAKKRILCVDDTGDDCELFSLILSEAGYHVESAQSFKDALQLIEKSRFDLCMFDMSISGRTGFELLQKIQMIDPLVPVIFCTADSRDSIREQSLQAGAQAFLTKPVDIDYLVEMIAKALQATELKVGESYLSG